MHGKFEFNSDLIIFEEFKCDGDTYNQSGVIFMGFVHLYAMFLYQSDMYTHIHRTYSLKQAQGMK